VKLPLKLEREAIVHGHCHHKAVIKLDAEKELLEGLGLEARVVDAGCCGMAGAFGFEKGETYEVSIKAGERVLLPVVRHADKRAIVVADGFSCREQIAQTTERRALHTAQVLQMALRYGPAGVEGDYPETSFQDPHDPPGAPKSPAYRNRGAARHVAAAAVLLVFIAMIASLLVQCAWR